MQKKKRKKKSTQDIQTTFLHPTMFTLESPDLQKKKNTTNNHAQECDQNLKKNNKT